MDYGWTIAGFVWAFLAGWVVGVIVFSRQYQRRLNALRKEHE